MYNKKMFKITLKIEMIALLGTKFYCKWITYNTK